MDGLSTQSRQYLADRVSEYLCLDVIVAVVAATDRGFYPQSSLGSESHRGVA